ncbi:MAG: GNAT family protein [bacterium]|nr:GNAT family protein [bacterium]
MTYHLNGKHIQLRSLTKEDIPALIKHGNDPLLRKHLGANFPSPYDLPVAQKWVEYVSKNEYGREEFGIFVDDQFVGCGGIELGKGFELKNMHVGYRIGADFRGKGYATDFLQTIVDYAFTKYDIHRIHSKVYSYNTASARVMEKVGFQREGVERQAICYQGEYADAWSYGLLKSEWQERS